MRIGLYGGSFNPIHNGHLIAARSVAEKLAMDRIFLIPAAVPPHKTTRNLAAPSHRLEMLRLAVEGEPLFEISDVELMRRGPSYTILTVEEFRRRFDPAAEICWIIGADSLPELVNWYQAERLVDLATIVTAARPGWEAPDPASLRTRFSAEQVDRLLANILPTPQIDIASREIRARVAAALSIRYLVPDAVAEYIAREGLYRPRA